MFFNFYNFLLIFIIRVQSKIVHLLKKEENLSKLSLLLKIKEILPKKLKIEENEIIMISKTLCDKGFIEYHPEKEIFSYIP